MPRSSKYNLRHIEVPNSSSGIEFEKLRFEYAWRHFDIYSRQILQMFYLFLISVAFFCGALANVMNSQRSDAVQISSFIAIVGFAISLIFLAFDTRSRGLYLISRRHLEALEWNVLYPDGFRELFDNPTERIGRVEGIMIEDAKHQRLLRHKFLIPLCHIGSAVLFFVLLLRINKFF